MGIAVTCVLRLLWMLISKGTIYCEDFIGFSVLLAICWLCDTTTDNVYVVHFERKQISYTHTFIISKISIICRVDEIDALSVDGEIIGEG